jgi:ABC-type Fe3+-hydroxamate transport system substrate-binding protein
VAIITDDLGHPLSRSGSCERVVSLVPSLTESIASVRRAALVGATDWCTNPADLDVTRVRGTKNPDLAKIVALQPDLVVANREENRRIDVERLRATGVPVWLTVIESVPQALESLRRMFAHALGWDVPPWLDEADAAWARPGPPDGPRVVVPVWRDPWIVVGARTFTGDLVTPLGLRNLYAEAAERYPHVDVEQIRAAAPDVVLLPDEPYPFTSDDGPECFPGAWCVLIEGRSLTWYGPSLVTAAELVTRAISASMMARRGVDSVRDEDKPKGNRL